MMVQSLEPGSKARDILSGTALAKTTGFSGVEGETTISLSPIWSPDGREIVFSATTERWNAAFTHVGYHLYRMPADGSAEPRLATPAKGEFQAARSFQPGRAGAVFPLRGAGRRDLPPVASVQGGLAGAGANRRWWTRDFDRETARLRADAR